MVFSSRPGRKNVRAPYSRARRRRFAPRLEVLEDRLAPAATITVNSLLDANTRDAVLTLREAILVNNRTLAVASLTAAEQAQVSGTPTSSDADTILFAIGAGVQTISPTAALPTITDPVTIDGTAPAALPTQKIELNGVGAGSSSNGLTITAGSSTVRGLVINRFAIGISLQTGGGNHVEGCFIGLDPGGTLDLGNAIYGLSVSSADNVIGGTAPGAGNVISGNNSVGILFTGSGAQRNLVQGNRIGTNAASTAAVPNGSGIILQSLAGNTTIGGSVPAARNIVSGNSVLGIAIVQGAGTVIIGNYVGTDVTGTVALSNNGNGIIVYGGANNVRIGGTAPGEGNLVSGNRSSGINVGGPSTQILGNFIGTDVTGNAPLGNGNPLNLAGAGITVAGASDLLVAGNLISANYGWGIDIGAVSGLRVENNRIGTNAAGTGDLGNLRHGIRAIVAGQTGAVIGGTASGAGNIIAFNDGDGVSVTHQDARGVAVLGNSIFANDGLGIDLHLDDGVTPNDPGDADTGANLRQNYPVLSAVSSSGGSTTIDGALNSTANTTFRLEFFANNASDPSGFGEGQRYLGYAMVSTPVGGNDVSFSVTLPTAVSAGEFVTATATDPGNNTSEFSQGLMVAATNHPPTANAGPDQTADEGAAVSFDGTGSSDRDI